LKFNIGVTENHVFLIDLRPLGLNSLKTEWFFDEISILVTKTSCPGEKDTSNPSGIRIGTPAITARNTCENEMKQIAGFIDEGFKLVKEISQVAHGDTLSDFKEATNNENIRIKISELKDRVEKLAVSLPIPGFYN
jgi:glycine hydroxymethyltransferase